MNVKEELINKLKDEHCLWSYNLSSISDVPDDIVIEKVMVYLDIEDINLLFSFYGYKKVKKVWIKHLIPQGEYLYLLNRFFAWYYFKVKNPDSYIKSMTTRHFNKLLSL